ncbi:MAG: BamA/TamA family outer membrane protein [Glaciecola sp.]
MTIRFLQSAAIACCLLCIHAISQATTFTINGVDNSDINNNIQLFLQEVSSPVSQYELDDYQQQLVLQADKALQAFAYHNADITVPSIVYEAEKVTSVTLQISVNKQTQISRVILQHDITAFEQLPAPIAQTIQAVNKLQNKPLNHSQYDSLRNALSTYAVLYGYFDFSFVLHKLLIMADSSNAASTATVHWIFNLGERYKFGDVVFINDTRGQDIALKVKPFKTGEYFEQSKVGQFSIDMASTRYFDSAIARANANQSSNKLVPIEVILEPKPKDLFKYGIGFSTDTGPRLSVDWTRPWVNIAGNSLGANLYLSQPQQSISASYRVPKDNPLKDFINYQAGFKRVNENQTQSDTITFAAQRQWGATEDFEWDIIAFTKLEQESFIQGLQAEQTTRLVMPGLTLNRLRKRGDLFVDWGDRQQITVEGASASVLSDIDLFKITARTKWIREFDKHRWMLRGDVGMIATNDFDQVPSSQRYFAGGDQSIRGFGLNDVSDIVETTVNGEVEFERVGGKFLSAGSIEYAYRFMDNWRIATFLDVGSAGQSFAEDLSMGYGLGGHWLSPIGNVQLYIARGESDFENTWRVHLIIGPGL